MLSFGQSRGFGGIPREGLAGMAGWRCLMRLGTASSPLKGSREFLLLIIMAMKIITTFLGALMMCQAQG